MPLEIWGPAHDGSGAAEPDHVPTIERVANRIATLSQELAHLKKIMAELKNDRRQKYARRQAGK